MAYDRLFLKTVRIDNDPYHQSGFYVIDSRMGRILAGPYSSWQAASASVAEDRRHYLANEKFLRKYDRAMGGK